jgi:hypothetical protein
MSRCRLSGGDECQGHDCIDRVGIPCLYDNAGVAGTEDLVEEDHDYPLETHTSNEGVVTYHITGVSMGCFE